MRPIDADKLKADFWDNVGDNTCFTLAVALRIIDRQKTIDPDESPLFLDEIKAEMYEKGFKDGERSKMNRLYPKEDVVDALKRMNRLADYLKGKGGDMYRDIWKIVWGPADTLEE